MVGVALASCGEQADAPAPTNVQATPTAEPEAPAEPMVPAPRPVLTRADLIRAAADAASLYAEGTAPTAKDPLVGRNFAVRISFGCGGPATSQEREDHDGTPAWRRGPDRKTIELRMTPSDWTGSALLADAGASETWEAVEGFWLPRPWLMSETCPSVRTDPLQTSAPARSPQTIGLAAVFEAGGSRVGRRNGRAYSHVVRAEGDTPLEAPAKGYRMLLEGRIAAFPSERAFECRASGPDQRPVCIAAIQLDRVTYEDAAGSTLSEWRPG